jgi:hypothetical protein
MLKTPRLSIEGTDTKETEIVENYVWLVVTTLHVYIMENPGLYEGGKGDGLLSRKFNTCPRPVVLRRFPILCLNVSLQKRKRKKVYLLFLDFFFFEVFKFTCTHTIHVFVFQTFFFFFFPLHSRIYI